MLIKSTIFILLGFLLVGCSSNKQPVQIVKPFEKESNKDIKEKTAALLEQKRKYFEEELNVKEIEEKQTMENTLDFKVYQLIRKKHGRIN